MIEIINRQRKHRIRTKAFRRLLESLAAEHGLEDPDIGLAFVGLRAIRTLNRKYGRKDRPTDVLSFPVGKKGPDGRFYLGDIVISVPVARAKSGRDGRALDRELAILAIHGFFHLLGFDHSPEMEGEEKAARTEFWR